MNIRSAALAGALVIVPFQNAAQNPARPGVVVSLPIHVYNLADVHITSLEHALGVTARILAAAGIEPVFEPGNADSPEAHRSDFTRSSLCSKRQKPHGRDFLVVRIVRGFPAEVLPSMLGFSLPFAQNGVDVTVFYDRVERAGSGTTAARETVLGSALAHEIGHVLLRSAEHSASGIMRAVWGRADYQCMAERIPEFQPAQAAAMREEVRRRVGMELSPLPLGHTDRLASTWAGRR
jgi:hypothetical protein